MDCLHCGKDISDSLIDAECLDRGLEPVVHTEEVVGVNYCQSCNLASKDD